MKEGKKGKKKYKIEWFFFISLILSGQTGVYIGMEHYITAVFSFIMAMIFMRIHFENRNNIIDREASNGTGEEDEQGWGIRNIG